MCGIFIKCFVRLATVDSASIQSALTYIMSVSNRPLNKTIVSQ
jgi:hypothetical protein